MLRKTLFALTMAVLFSLAGGNAFAAEPTLHQVYQAAETGDYRAAQAMMDQVLRDHPNSAKAHFVEAELLAKQGRLAEARGELETAQRLAPGLPFAKPEAVRELHARLSSPQGWGQSGAHNPLASVGSWSPWGMLLLIVGLVALFAFAVRAMRQRAVGPAQGAMVPNYGGGVNPAQPYGATPMAPTGGVGSALLGGLATGAALGAGMVAGEALMHRVLDGRHSDGVAPAADNGSWADSQPDFGMGGNDFGVADAGSWDDGSSLGGGDDWS
ncbi:MAG TPA: tetratricopeptide repeat protein [Burkholderiales bacterium]|nr:tetratricopeptide repeat protein [Burkholderiales bacterium]